MTPRREAIVAGILGSPPVYALVRRLPQRHARRVLRAANRVVGRRRQPPPAWLVASHPEVIALLEGRG